MKFKTFLAEIKNSLKQYAALNLIDDQSVYNWVKWELKSFGNLPFSLKEKVIEVKNYKAKAPEGFNKIFMIAKCEPDKYKLEGGTEEKILDERFWIERHETKRWFDPCDSCNCWEDTEKVIHEKVFFKNNIEATYTFKDPQLLNLKEGFTRKNCDKNCLNHKYSLTNAEDVILRGNTLNFSFEDGFVYMWYKGFDIDEDGFIEIPETNNGHLKRYLENYVKSQIMLEVIANSDNAQNEGMLLNTFERRANTHFRAAMTELKAQHFTMSAFEKYRKRLKLETSKIR